MPAVLRDGADPRTTILSVDPYRVLEVGPGASEAELRAAYRHAVQRTHPDHNRAPDAAREFEAVQEAWTRIRRLRDGGRSRAADPPSPPADPGLDARLAAMEGELRAARAARERAERAAREAAAATRAESGPDRPSDEELGYVRTDDSFGKILADAREEVLGDLREQPVRERAADLLDEVAAALRGERPKRSP